MINISASTQAIGWGILSCFLMAVMVSIVKYLDNSVHPAQLVFWRNMIGFALLFPWFVFHKKTTLFPLQLTLLKWCVWRAILSVVALLIWYYVLTKVTLSHAVALSFTAPLFAGLVAMIWLKERVGPYRILSLVSGFVGVVVILDPHMDGFKLISLWVLAVSLLLGISMVMNKFLTKEFSSRHIVFYTSFLTVPLSLPMAIIYWHWPTAEQWMWMLLIGLSSTLAQLSLSTAMSKADISFLLPFDFSRLVFVSIIGYVVFSEMVKWNTLVGAAIVGGSAFFITYREMQRSKRQQEKEL